MTKTPEMLWQRTRDGDREAASELIAMFYERLYGWFRRLAGNDEDAADLTQKTFGQLWTSLGSFQGRSGFSTWLHGIGHHVYLDWRRRTKFTERLPDEWWKACATDEPAPWENVSEREVAHQLYALVEQLDEDTRHTVHLHYYEGLSIAETASALEVATSTVKYRLRQAVQFLRTRLAEPKQFLS